MVRSIAYSFSCAIGYNNVFGKKVEENKAAGDHWFRSLMEQCPELSIRKSEGLFLARAQGINREDVNRLYNVWKGILEEHELQDKPHKIYNIDEETGIQMYQGKLVALKGSKCVQNLTSKQKGEIISLLV
ncbi:hypothetical protein NQ317_009426 [Molorchus minor]|uniref:Uncharacterized protein n=1 Tax=Molorchus minor TaxID=1323400 RepID=A0ABQ9J8S6_9CUCU|nr:hypothetical protein NQ317_009426 [Molorchus minor]